MQLDTLGLVLPSVQYVPADEKCSDILQTTGRPIGRQADGLSHLACGCWDILHGSQIVTRGLQDSGFNVGPCGVQVGPSKCSLGRKDLAVMWDPPVRILQISARFGISFHMHRLLLRSMWTRCENLVLPVD